MGMTLSEVQFRAWANKVRQGFNTTDVALETGLLHKEVSEFFDAWRKGDPEGPELSDIVIFAAGLFAMRGLDMNDEVAKKLAVNESRTYIGLPNGTKVKAVRR